MNKFDFIEIFAEKNGISKKLSKSVVDIILKSMQDALVSGERIEIRGFGSFFVKEYESYEGRNPKTGEKIEVDKKLAPFFKVSKAMASRDSAIKSENYNMKNDNVKT